MVPSIESPFTLLKKPVEVIRFDTVILSHVSLCPLSGMPHTLPGKGFQKFSIPLM